MSTDMVLRVLLLGTMAAVIVVCFAMDQDSYRPQLRKQRSGRGQPPRWLRWRLMNAELQADDSKS